MATETFLSPCPVCERAPLTAVEGRYACAYCGLTIRAKKAFLGLKSTGTYTVESISPAYSIAGLGLVAQDFSLEEIKQFRESVYSDAELAQFAEGDYQRLNPPASTLAQILLEQLREDCYLQINQLRRALGPVLTGQAERIPHEKISRVNLTWQDRGNLFLTNIRLVFPSDSFTFIRMDRKLVGVVAYTDGLAVQRKGEDFATYFAGCAAHQSALAAAYIMGKVPLLRQEQVESAGSV
jgi:hypothetical protein